MSNPQDKSNTTEQTQRFDELLATIRAATAPDAAADARSAGAIACRAILGALDPASRPAVGSPSVPQSTNHASATSPLAALFGAVGQIPREQLLGFFGGLRRLLAAPGPTYLARPASPTQPTRPQGDGA